MSFTIINNHHYLDKGSLRNHQKHDAVYLRKGSWCVLKGKFMIMFMLLFGMLCLFYSIMCAYPQMKWFIHTPLAGNSEWLKTFFIFSFCTFCGLGEEAMLFKFKQCENGLSIINNCPS